MRFHPLTLALLVIVQPGFALELRTYNSSAHDRFLDFTNSNARHNPGFLHAPVDFTGVGWHSTNKARQLTLVSPRHFVGANHWKPPVGATIRFLSADGTLRNYTVAQLEAIPNAQGDPSDLFLGTLSAEVSSSAGVAFHPYLNLPTESAYNGQQLMVLGKNARGGRGSISGFTDVGEGSVIGGGSINSTRMFSIAYGPVGGGDDAYAEAGDSGSPSFANRNGVAALVGTHSLVATVTEPLGSVVSATTFDTFVPHYLAGLNVLMEAEGYHMTAEPPGSTVLTATQQAGAPVVRAGYPVTIAVEVRNTGLGAANNLRLTNVAPPGVTQLNGSGAGWIAASASSGQLAARRGGLASGATSLYEVTLTVSEPGSVQNEIALSSDEFASETFSLDLEVIESFRSWSAGLANKASNSDDDRDEIELLLEYAFGGDPEVSSTRFPGTDVPLLPEIIEGDELILRYIMRQDAAERLLEYEVEFSDDLTPGSWANVSGLGASTSVLPLPGDFDLVEVRLARVVPRRFVRVKVTLSE